MRITNKEQWLELYKAAERVRDLKAWEWMFEEDMFIVEDPNNPDNIGFCSLMGANGEFHGLAIYRGWDGYRSYNDLLFAGDFDSQVVTMNYGLMQSCWMVEFTNSKTMNDSAKKVLKELDLKYRGDLNWIDITERVPGYAPWYVNEEDVPFLTTCINQYFEIALRGEESTDFLHKPNPDFKELDYDSDDDDDIDEWLEHSEELMLKRVGTLQPDGKMSWRDEYIDTAPFEETDLNSERITPSIRAAAVAKKLKQKEAAIMIGMLMMPSPMEESKEDAPFFACLNLHIQYGTNYIIGQTMKSYDETRADFEKDLLALFEKIGFVPSQLVVNMPVMEDWLDAFAELFDFEVILNPADEGFEDVFGSMMEMLDGME